MAEIEVEVKGDAKVKIKHSDDDSKSGLAGAMELMCKYVVPAAVAWGGCIAVQGVIGGKSSTDMSASFCDGFGTGFDDDFDGFDPSSGSILGDIGDMFW